MATPRDQIASYSTQFLLSTNTSPTYLSILNEIDARLPNVVASSDKIGWMNNTVKLIWKYMASTKIHSTNTGSSQALYLMPTDMRFDKIKAVMVSDSTAASTTELYTIYEPVGMDEELEGNCYYKAGGTIGVYPVPTSAGHIVKISYEPLPPVYASTTDTTSVPLVNLDYVNLIKFDTLKQVAVAGNAPDVEMGNNYDSEFSALFERMKLDYYKNKTKAPKSRFSYKDKWWSG